MPGFFHDHRLSACATERSGSGILVLVHNHPSGDPCPSAADIEATRKVAEALKAIGVTLHDHLIVGRSGHSSLRNAGLMG